MWIAANPEYPPRIFKTKKECKKACPIKAGWKYFKFKFEPSKTGNYEVKGQRVFISTSQKYILASTQDYESWSPMQ